MLGSIEAKSSHPIAQAFVDYLQTNKLDVLDVTNFENIAGIGIKAEVNSKRVLLGNSKILEKYNIENSYANIEDSLAESGNSIVYIVIGNEIAGIVGINDIIRENARDTIATLNENNIKTIMLTRR